MSRVIWGGFGFTPFDWLDEKDFWKMLRETITQGEGKIRQSLSYRYRLQPVRMGHIPPQD